MSKHLSLRDQTTEFLLYTAPNGAIKVEVLLSGETLWLTQKRMADLFGVGVPAVSKHLKNIFESSELDQDAAISILETTAEDGKKYQTQYYNRQQAEKKAFAEYEKFNKQQRIESDFDREVKKLLQNKGAKE